DLSIVGIAELCRLNIVIGNKSTIAALCYFNRIGVSLLIDIDGIVITIAGSVCLVALGTYLLNSNIVTAAFLFYFRIFIGSYVLRRIPVGDRALIHCYGHLVAL